ncbi:MAG: hypothetical protein V3T30_04490, partial [Thermodesulfobacteriota bacterium]
MSDASTKVDGDRKRRLREFYIILGIIPFIVLITYIESHISLISGDVPIATNILVLGLININVILLILLIFLVMRNTVKLFFESRSKVMGSKLRTKLIASFVGLTIVPTFILFFFVISFINRSIDAWFDIKIESSLETSLILAQNYYKDTSEKTLSEARRLSAKVSGESLLVDREKLAQVVLSRIEESDFASIEVFTATGERVAYTISDGINTTLVPEAPVGRITEALAGVSASSIETFRVGDVVRGGAPIYGEGDGGGQTVLGAMIVSYYVPGSLIVKMKEISAAFESYKQLKLLKNPVKATYFMILLIITLLLVFFSIWIGRYIAKGITVPIH